MLEGDTDGLLPDREHYRELAGQLREMARLARSAFARKELLRLATSFDYRARYLGRYKDWRRRNLVPLSRSDPAGDPG
jgi:hypothetical protein